MSEVNDRNRFRKAPFGEGGRSAARNPRAARRLKAIEKAILDNEDVLVGWLARKFGDLSVAHDIAQDAYLRVWRYAHEEDIDNPRALIFKTAANLAANEFKARRRFQAGHVDPFAFGDNSPVDRIPADDPSPERIECARQDLEACRQAIESLPDKARRAFILSRFEGLTYLEIARRIGVSVSSVEKYIILALKTLRASLEAGDSDSTILDFSAARGEAAKKSKAGKGTK